MEVYERQGGICTHCVAGSCQLLCIEHNRR